jgi:gluconate:H+ symporter, GntP family
MDPLLIILIGMVVVIGGIIGFKMHPFFALLFGAFAVALLTSGSTIEQYAISQGASQAAAHKMASAGIGTRIATEFGNTCGKVGIIVAMAAVIGKCMLESGAAEKIVRSILRLFGINRTPIALIITSFFIGIPVFFDTVIFMMFPLAKSLTIRTGKNYLLFILCIIAGTAMATSLVPPNPGPVFLAGALKIPIGEMILGGTIIGLCTLVTGFFWANWANKKWQVPLRDSLDARLEDIKTASEKDEKLLPSLFFSLLPVLIPIVFIVAATFLQNFSHIDNDPTHNGFINRLVHIILFFGDKNVALIGGGIASILVLTRQLTINKGGGLGKSVSSALTSGGNIILIICAGGTFGAMLQQTGVSTVIADLTKDFQMALIPMAFLITAAIRTAQGSATVALITSSGILAGLVSSGVPLEYNPMYLALAIGCGSKLIAWMNDSGFWVVTKMSNLTENEALKSYSPMLLIMGFTGLFVIMLGAKFLPLV